MSGYFVGDRDDRPWGSWEVLAVDEAYVIKKIIVSPGQKLSLQKHKHRRENWLCISGTGRVQLGDEIQEFKTGSTAVIEQGQQHRLECCGTGNLVLIEIQTGTVLDEDDIIRLEDIYGRLSD